MKKICLFLASIILLVNGLDAQINIPKFSEPGSISQTIGFTNIKIEYERPMQKGRKIFGGLVPYDQVWRTGAGPCTKIYFDKPVSINKTTVAPGAYALFTIPGISEWTIILNTDTSLYGAYRYNSEKDVVRLKVKPRKTVRSYEALNIDVDIVNNDAEIFISWEQTQVNFQLKTTTQAIFMQEVQNALKNDRNLEADKYANAADYIIHNRLGFGKHVLDTAMMLIDRSFEIEEDSYFYRIKRDILMLKRDYDSYLTVSEAHIAYLQKAKPYNDYEKEIERIQRKNQKLRDNH
ncbi:DUF2911 domain-containing protein [Fulvivirgaceae bacterium BMA10]|uniref:DUF2911 domain-containing protein n=1 Tax=Splendidivirga corallicola TaxID=3051826 RepID=A0ABT8KP07_9BACT|nr:DUF2911 domain-containing protein [Fulvivirgaceae bacterium BMA10]